MSLLKPEALQPSPIRSDLLERNYSGASNLAFNEKIKRLNKEGQNISHFGFGQSPFPIIETAIGALQKQAHQNSYLPVQGIPELRKKICDFHKHYDQVDFDPEDVIVGPGSKELILLLLTVFNGDVLVNSPSWTTYRPQAILTGHTAYNVDSSEEDEWKVTVTSLEKVITENDMSYYKILILTNPCNPTGTCYTESELRKLTEVFRRHHVLVLSDEIYARVHYTHSHVCLSKVYPEGTVLSTGMSKWASAGGWRVGYHVYPKELSHLLSVVKSAASHSFSCAPAPMQYAFVEVIQNKSACDDYIKHTTRIMKVVAEFCVRELQSVGVKVVPPKAGYYIFPNFEVIRGQLARRGVRTCQEMCDLILSEVTVAVMPGGPDHLRPADELTTRLCYVNFDGALALAESRKLGLDVELDASFVEDVCTPVYQGIVKLRNWILELKTETIEKQ
ncbi:aspartate aminotransferase-like [Physella acuta]|uniref:aspartate aminotransferase-like n=1 Tax=Physella acuta TaxID=109671 RepID=UPI0027DB1846|nr:aspartate aminotransferase-like [Physella acuta]XP_059143854.1 aspartate aminotransferase-like [Physella acuta]